MHKERVMSIQERQDEIIEEFSMFDEWMEKYEHIIALGRELKPMPGQFKTDEFVIKGCQSKVWLNAEIQENGNISFLADSDAIITKGLVALMVRVLDDQKPEDVMQADLFFVEKIGLHDHLSPTRSNGLLAMIKQMKYYGLAIQAKG